MSMRKVILGLGLLLLLGNGAVVAADYDKGLKAYRSYDFTTAIEELTSLADQGNAEAQYYLGRSYMGDENDKAGLKWTTLAAEQGHLKAQLYLGVAYIIGMGPERRVKSVKKSLKFYTLAAKQGDGLAQFFLGEYYRFGTGVLIDYKRAYMWYNISSYNDADQPDARNRLNYLAEEMTPAQVAKAQEMSSRCLESNYTDC